MKINPYNYIIPTKSSPCSKEFVKRVAQGVESITRGRKFIFEQEGAKVFVAQKTTDIFPEMADMHPRGWGNSSWDEVSGTVDGRNIYCFEAPNDSYITAAVRHEAGHSLDNLVEQSTGQKISLNQAFLNVYLSDLRANFLRINDFSKKFQTSFQYFLQGSNQQKASAAGLSETFAEIFAKENGGGVFNEELNGFDKMFDRIFPRTVAYVKRFLDALEQ